MYKKIKECSFTQLYVYKMNNLKDIMNGNIEFPIILLYFLDSPIVNDYNSVERNKKLKSIFKEIRPELLETIISIEDDLNDY